MESMFFLVLCPTKLSARVVKIDKIESYNLEKPLRILRVYSKSVLLVFQFERNYKNVSMIPSVIYEKLKIDWDGWIYLKHSWLF